MRVHELLTEVAAADASVAYGYWVSHTGDVLEVDFQNHMPVDRAALDDLGLLNLGHEYGLTLALGWVAFRVEFRNRGQTEPVVNIDIEKPDRMTQAGTQGCVRLLGRLDKLYVLEGCRIATSRRFGSNHAWMRPEVRKPTAQAAKWLTDHSGKLAEPKFSL